MGLETATYIDGLVVSNPAGGDDRSQGDDHIRLIKSAIKNTFPNINGVVTPTDEQLNATIAPGALNFPGMIVMWSGTIATIPSGWKLCNGVGTISTGLTVPNLVDRFIIGSATDSGGTYNIRGTGGSKDVVVSGTTGGTALTTAQIPAHSHTKTYTYVAGGALNLGFIYNDPEVYHGGGDSRSGAGNKTMTTSSVGSGQAHTHTFGQTITNGNIPPYYALAFIIKN